MLTSLDAAVIQRWTTLGLSALRRHREEIDALNVYPVPDGDTGTNLLLTMEAAANALAEAPLADDPGRALRIMARGALLGARGNSGVIVSQLLRGLADSLRAEPVVRGEQLARALTVAAHGCYEAVAEPVEGTILSVAAAAAKAARASGEDLVAVVTGAARGAAEALALTPSQLPALARAGVVDAGGRGLVVLLDALVAAVTGGTTATPPLGRVARVGSVLVAERESGSAEYAYEVQYLLDAPAEAVARLKGELTALGDSVVVVGAGVLDGEPEVWNVHAHVSDVGAAIEAGIEAGRPHRISVTRFADSVPVPDEPAFDPRARATVAVAHGPGLEQLFATEGVLVVAGIPSTADVLAAIVASGAGSVVVLPNDSNVRAVAAAAAEEARAGGQLVSVVGTKSPVQAIAALAVRDPERLFSEDVIAMAEAAAATRWAEVTVAARDSLTLAGPCQAGDVLGLVEGEVVLIGAELRAASVDLLDRMLGGGGELVTLVLGADAPAGLADELTAHARSRWPFVEVQVYDGGQPHYPLLVGVE